MTSGATAREEEYSREIDKLGGYLDKDETFYDKMNAAKQNIIFQLEGNYWPLPRSERKYFTEITGYKPGIQANQLLGEVRSNRIKLMQEQKIRGMQQKPKEDDE